MSTTSFQYKATFGVTGKIQYKPTQGEVGPEDTIELSADENLSYKILAKLSSRDGTSVIQSMILEENPIGPQDPVDFGKYAEEILSQHLNRIKFVSGENSATLTNGVVKDHLGKQHSVAIGGLKMGGHSASVMDKPRCEQAFREKSNKNLDEYIDRHLSISKITDPVLKLISLFALCEFVVGRDREQAENIALLIESDSLPSAARNLVAHGRVKRTKTMETLNETFNTPAAKFHEFSRGNNKHMKLVIDCGEELSSTIKNHIYSLL
ncbi:hypothetical protein [Leptolyngbya sp. FACHB-261]|uniref:hypothetical protein n=1 Tax=Leptolyngbya sp. FACHB-261 TaxID=2692806 RepID=UPI0016866F7F|nr:hypothetical protein [Leptolyngbya sp. FACHB-261]MBD2103870.1 hypothetical protein [Leptolyngbya sp. FACHB-261]